MATTPRYVGTDAATAQAYVRKVLGNSRMFYLVFDLDGDGVVAHGSEDEEAFVAAVCAAETEVDEHLAQSHGAPFTGAIPDSVRQISALRCLWCAVRTRELTDAEKMPARVLYKDTDARLERIKKDDGARIPEKGVPEPTASALAASTSPATPWSDAADRKSWSW